MFFFSAGVHTACLALLSPLQGLQTARLHHYLARIIIGRGSHRLPRVAVAPSGLCRRFASFLQPLLQHLDVLVEVLYGLVLLLAFLAGTLRQHVMLRIGDDVEHRNT